MLVSHSHRFVFIHIPKTAGTSIASVLEPYCCRAKGTRFRRILRKTGVRQDPHKAHFRSHDQASHALAAFGQKKFDTYTVFSVVRNPFDHAVSHYTFLRGFPDRHVADFFSGLDFRAYLEFRINPKRSMRMPLLARMKDQTEFLFDTAGRCLAHEVIRFETLPDGLNDLLVGLKLPRVELPRKRVTQTRQQSLEHYYTTREQVDAVFHLYHRDFENFGYERRIPS